MRKIKAFILPLAILLTLVIIGLSLWVLNLNSTISDGLKNKHFLQPTEYYSAPQKFLSTNNISSKDIKKELTKRNYRHRQVQQKLFPGDFTELDTDECSKLISDSRRESHSCLLWIVKEMFDPDSVEQQLAVFSAQGNLISSYQGNPLLKKDFVQLEPELIAQYLGKEPIMQSYLPLGEFPTHCLNSILAIEDAKFLEHSGVSYTGIGRALLKNLFQGRMSQGGSTITQQMVKNYFLTSERTLKRKFTEFFMSLLLEAHSSKDEILETYLNIIYLGQNGPFQVRGFPAAAQYYFQKPVKDLTISDCSLLSAIVANPGVYNPFKKNPEAVIKRKALVLEKMKLHGFINENDYQQALKQGLPVNNRPMLSETAPYYVDAVQKELLNKQIDISSGGKVFTGLSVQAQEFAQDAVRTNLTNLESENKKIKIIKESGKNLEGLLISAEAETGLITAIVGGRGYRLTQFNRAIDGHRQIGSIMKPFVFLTALLNKKTDGTAYTPTTILSDKKFNYAFDNGRQKWSPENYGKKYYDDVPMYFALKKSLNAATASLGLEIGLDKIIEVTHRLGVTSKMDTVPALTLGAFELYPIEVLQAYLTINRMGSFIPAGTVRSVVSSDGKIIYQRQTDAQTVIDSDKMASLVSMLKQTVLSGSAQLIHNSGFQVPAAGKTGTTSDSRDAWFAGFTAQTIAVTWVGYDDNTEHGLTGASGAVPIWLSYMKNAAATESTQDFIWPENTDKIRYRDPELQTDVELITSEN